MAERSTEFNFETFLEELGIVAPGHRLDPEENKVNPQLVIPEIRDKMVTIICAVATGQINTQNEENGLQQIKASTKKLVELYPDRKEDIKQMVSDRSAEDLRIRPDDPDIFGEKK